MNTDSNGWQRRFDRDVEFDGDISVEASDNTSDSSSDSSSDSLGDSSSDSSGDSCSDSCSDSDTAIAVAVALASAKRRSHSGRRKGYVNLDSINAVDFKRRYRLTMDEFNSLHSTIQRAVPAYIGERSTRLSSRVRLASALRFLAGGSAIDVALTHGQREPAFYTDFRETIAAINKAVPLGIDWEDPIVLQGIAERNVAGSGEGCWQNIIGYLDGIVVRTEKPRATRNIVVGDQYCDRKKCMA